MFRFLFFSALVASGLALTLTPEKFSENCLKFMTDKSCCKTTINLQDEVANAVKECLKIPMDDLSCERDICLATQRGIAATGDSFDRAKAIENLKNLFADDFPKLYAGIMKYCINDDISKYGPPEMCELRKYRHCVEIQQYNTCTEWSDDESCTGAKEAAVKCAAIFD